jgi:hypothetical protein
MRVKITDINPQSQYYESRDKLIGKIIEFENLDDCSFDNYSGWKRGKMISGDLKGHALYGFKYEPVEETAMSEFGECSINFPGGIMNQDGSVSYHLTRKQPKKLSWLQKIRGYDDLQSALDCERDFTHDLVKQKTDLQERCKATESMRDHYKTTAETWQQTTISKARDLELMSKVADSWQQKAIDANKRSDTILNDYISFLDELEKELMKDANTGRRLKFSVGHNHIEIVIGNPVTYIYNYNETETDEEGYNTDYAVSICSEKDQYDWKKGVIQSLKNLCSDWDYTKDFTRLLFEVMFKKYPELK